MYLIRYRKKLIQSMGGGVSPSELLRGGVFEKRYRLFIFASMQGVYDRKNKYLDLRKLVPVQERTDRMSDWDVETLLEHNGYLLCRMELWDVMDYIGMEKNEQGHWMPFDVMSMHIFGCCVDKKTGEEYNLLAQPWYAIGDKDGEWLKEVYVGRRGGWYAYAVEKARIRFTRRKDGCLLDPRWVEVECFDMKLKPTGGKIDYELYGNGLKRVQHERWAYLCSNDCWEYPAEVTMKELM